MRRFLPLAATTAAVCLAIDRQGPARANVRESKSQTMLVAANSLTS